MHDSFAEKAAHLLVRLVFCAAVAFPLSAAAGNCLVQGDKKIGDCADVHVGPAKPLTISKDSYHSGNFGPVVVKRNVNASLSGNVADILVEPGASLRFSGNAAGLAVFGSVEIDGNAGWVTVHKGGQATIRGIVQGVSGAGKIIKARGAIVNGEYIH